MDKSAMVDTSDIPEGGLNELYVLHVHSFGETYDSWRAGNAFDANTLEGLLRMALETDTPLTDQKLHQVDETYPVVLEPGPPEVVY